MLIRGLTKDAPAILTIRIEILSQPCALFKSKAHMMANTLALSIVIPSSRWSVFKYSAGRTLPVASREHCNPKNSLKILAFSETSVTMMFLLLRIGGILGVFRPWRNLFRIDQYFLGQIFWPIIIRFKKVSH